MIEQLEMFLLLFALLAQSFVDFVKVALTERDHVAIRWRFSAPPRSSRWRSERVMKVGVGVFVNASPC